MIVGLLMAVMAFGHPELRPGCTIAAVNSARYILGDGIDGWRAEFGELRGLLTMETFVRRRGEWIIRRSATEMRHLEDIWSEIDQGFLVLNCSGVPVG